MILENINNWKKGKKEGNMLKYVKSENISKLIAEEITCDPSKYKRLEEGKKRKVLVISENNTLSVENFCFDNDMQTEKAASSARVHHGAELKASPKLKIPLSGNNTNHLTTTHQNLLLKK
jgi:hypothetical protein